MPFWDKWINKKEPPPVDRKNSQLLSGKQIDENDPSYLKLDPTGMQKDYKVLMEEERAKGFVRPLRYSYTHKTCGTTTRMHRAFAETYARDPGYYSDTFCCACKIHCPVREFVWEGTNVQVGS